MKITSLTLLFKKPREITKKAETDMNINPKKVYIDKK